MTRLIPSEHDLRVFQNRRQYVLSGGSAGGIAANDLLIGNQFFRAGHLSISPLSRGGFQPDEGDSLNRRRAFAAVFDGKTQRFHFPIPVACSSDFHAQN
jgi:hypothetical protein